VDERWRRMDAARRRLLESALRERVAQVAHHWRGGF
jgi:hypothetical protein